MPGENASTKKRRWGVITILSFPLLVVTIAGGLYLFQDHAYRHGSTEYECQGETQFVEGRGNFCLGYNAPIRERYEEVKETMPNWAYELRRSWNWISGLWIGGAVFAVLDALWLLALLTERDAMVPHAIHRGNSA